MIVSLLAVASMAGPVTPRYVNEKYGFSVALLTGTDVCKFQDPPGRNDGAGVLIRQQEVRNPPCDDDIDSGFRYTAASAHYEAATSPTLADFSRTECPQLAYDSQGKVQAIDPPVQPGGLNWVACRIDGSNDTIIEVLFARQERRLAPTIDYFLTLKTTHAAYGKDYAAFVRWLRSIRITKPPL